MTKTSSSLLYSNLTYHVSPSERVGNSLYIQYTHCNSRAYILYESIFTCILEREDNGTLSHKEKKIKLNKAKPKARGLSACETEKGKKRATKALVIIL